MDKTAEKLGLHNWHLDEIIDILKKYSLIEKATIFGSRAKGDFKRASDIDICIYGDTPSFFEGVLKEQILEETNIPYFIDVVSYNVINNEKLKDNIDTDSILIYEKET